MMNKEKCEHADLDIIKFQIEDVITESKNQYEDDELPIIFNKP
ncbi:hypothetical protein [Ruminococcus sp.]|nr:hypothetical protein [Ruminococcus sp.]MEE1263349.1 hypothetical protein [Ruminococcus sp.]